MTRECGVSRIVALALLAIVGCSSPTDATAGPDAATIAMYLEGVPISRGAIVGMLPGNAFHFEASVKDPSGRTVASARPSIASRNTAAISLDSTGLMRVVGRGSSWIVAAYNSPTRGVIADSVTVAVVCTTEARAGLTLTVSDSITGVATGITSLSISARSGSVRDSVFYPTVPAGAALVQGLAYERAGTWDIRVNADGFRPWAALGVVVTADLCHVVGVPLAARLVRN